MKKSTEKTSPIKAVSVISHGILTFPQNDNPLKTEKCILFQLKSSFRSPDIQISVIFSSFPHFPNSKGQVEVE